MLQVHDGGPAQTCQTPEHGRTSEESLGYLRRLLAISTDEKELLEEKASVRIDYVNLGKWGRKLE